MEGENKKEYWKLTVVETLVPTVFFRGICCVVNRWKLQSGVQIIRHDDTFKGVDSP